MLHSFSIFLLFLVYPCSLYSSKPKVRRTQPTVIRLTARLAEYPLNWLTIMAYHPVSVPTHQSLFDLTCVDWQVLYCVLSNFYCRPSENKPLLKIWERYYMTFLL